MAELLAANQITIAKVLDGADGYSPTVTTGTSSDGSTTVTVTNKDGSTTTVLVDGTARDDAANAAKVATNYIGYDSTNGLIIGNKTSGAWSGYRSQILPGSFNVLDESSTVLASFGPTTVIGEEAKANMHLTFNNFSMVDRDGTKFFEVGDARNAEGIATIKHTAKVTVSSAGLATVSVNSYISSIVSVYADSVQLSSSNYSFVVNTVTINGLTANSEKTIEITYTTIESTVYLTFGDRYGTIGNYSVAAGHNTIASGSCSHAEGAGTTTSGFASHAEGDDTTASGYASHAGGYVTIADGDYMTAIGKFNTENSGKAFVVGNGTGNTARSDAFTVDWDGNTTMKGELAFDTATSAAATRANLGLTGAETKTLLWTNASPTSGFGEQTIGVDKGVNLSGYDYVSIEFCRSTGSPTYMQECRCKVGENVQSVFGSGFAYAAGKYAVGCVLREALTSTTGVHFAVGTDVTTVSSNNWCIPYRIYGIKEV